jgi:cullin-associated NEDD8-dissociated protein 1
MATHDLANELEKETFKLDQNAEPKLVTQLLKLMEDPANNVQENSVKWYAQRLHCIHDDPILISYTVLV